VEAVAVEAGGGEGGTAADSSAVVYFVNSIKNPVKVLLGR
jgi:hypothetical protein